jgi:hypothetical protein
MVVIRKREGRRKRMNQWYGGILNVLGFTLHLSPLTFALYLLAFSAKFTKKGGENTCKPRICRWKKILPTVV